MKKAFKKGDVVVSKVDNVISQVCHSYFININHRCNACQLNRICESKNNRERIQTATDWKWDREACACRYDKATEREEFLYTLGIIKKRGEDE